MGDSRDSQIFLCCGMNYIFEKLSISTFNLILGRPVDEGKTEFTSNIGPFVDYYLYFVPLLRLPHKAPTIRPPASHHENYPS